MKLKFLFWIFFFCFFSIAGYSQPTLQDTFQPPSNNYLIDNFDDVNLNFNPEWFQFGKVKLSVVWADSVANQKNFWTKFREAFLNFFWHHRKQNLTSKFFYSLLCQGETLHWYIGGLGTYLGIDGTQYQSIRFFLYGFGPNFGRLKIELFDDDNGNWKIELDSKFKTFYDDRWVYEVSVDWYGWRQIEIPFSYFKDDNTGIGDDIWNPDQKHNSGGLIQIQMIVLTPPGQESGKAKFMIDDMEFVRSQRK